MTETENAGSLFSENESKKENDALLDVMSEMAWWSPRVAAAEVMRLRGNVATLRAQLAGVREALAQIADHGWTYDGRHTYTLNCDVEGVDPRAFMATIERALAALDGAA